MQRMVTMKEFVWNDKEADKVCRFVSMLELSFQSPLYHPARKHEAGLRKRLACIRCGESFKEMNRSPDLHETSSPGVEMH
jgi:hypothetical protein